MVIMYWFPLSPLFHVSSVGGNETEGIDASGCSCHEKRFNCVESEQPQLRFMTHVSLIREKP